MSQLGAGIARDYEGHEPIQKNTLFIPTGFDAKMESYPAHIQKRLVDVGIYHPDGSVNLETAERMGWARTWREEEAARRVDAEVRFEVARERCSELLSGDEHRESRDPDERDTRGLRD